MKLTLRQLFDKYPILKQSEFAKMCDMHKVSLNEAVNGHSISKEQLYAMKAAIGMLAKALREVELVRHSFHDARGRYNKKAS